MGVSAKTFRVYLINGLLFGVIFATGLYLLDPELLILGVIFSIALIFISSLGWSIFYLYRISPLKKGKPQKPMLLLIMFSYIFLIPAALISNSIVEKSLINPPPVQQYQNYGGNAPQKPKKKDKKEKFEPDGSTLPWV